LLFAFKARLGHHADCNAATGSVVFFDGRNSLAHSDQAILTDLIGVDNLVVVGTPCALLVMSCDKAEQVKDLVKHLKAVGLLSGRRHRRALYGQALCREPSATLSLQK
jgi:hypothetical protein